MPGGGGERGRQPTRPVTGPHFAQPSLMQIGPAASCVFNCLATLLNGGSRVMFNI
jgi:hypothetical protein